jgi:hypothetical protein
LLRGDKSLLLKLKFEYILRFTATLLAYKGSKALICISIKVLATRGSLALLILILFASFNTRVAIVLKSRKLVAISSLLYKNQLKLTSSLLIPSLISLSKILINFITLLCSSSYYSLINYLAIRLITSSCFIAYSGVKAFGALITTTSQFISLSIKAKNSLLA